MNAERFATNLIRGPRPSSWKELQDLGVQVVVNLETCMYEMTHDDEYERGNAEDFGIAEHRIYCSDVSPPNRSKVGHIIEILKGCEDRGLVCYIHCLHGKDRTGFIVAVWRIVIDGWTFERARDEMFAKGYHRLPYETWLIALSKYAKP